MESPEYERERMARVKELEQMVKKLEQENKQLLTRVKTSASQSAERQPQTKGPGTAGALQEGGGGKELARLDSLEDVIIDLTGANEEEGLDDEWLYKSPACPPTPSQKQVTPLKWLSEGHASSKTLQLPSLDDVRKSLSFTIDEAESLSREPAPRTSPPLVAKNKTAQKYLEQVRARRLSPPPADSQDENQIELHPAEGAGPDTSGDVPIVRWKARMPASPTEGGGVEEVPKVSWSPRSARRRQAEGGMRPSVAEDQVEESEAVPKVSWKRPTQVPSDDVIPKVRWKPQAVVDDEDQTVHSQARDEQIPKVHWKRTQVVGDEEEMENTQLQDTSGRGGDEHIPKVRWKSRSVATPPEDVREAEDIPKVNWNSPRSVRKHPPRQQEEEIPKVTWKKPVIPEDQQEVGDDVPVVRWKPQATHGSSPRAADLSPRQSKHRNIPVKAIVTYRGRRPDEDQLSQESFGSGSEGGELENGRDSDVSLEDEASQPVQRPSRHQAHQPSLRQPGRGIQLPRHAGAVSPPVSRTLGSRSPSPLLHTTPQYQPASRSRSPSPSSAIRRGQQTSVIPQSGTQRQRQRTSSHNSPRTLSPGRRSNVSAGAPSSSIASNGSPARRKVVSPTGNSPQFTSPASTTPVATSRHPSGLPHHPTSAGSRTRPARTSLQSPKTGRDPSPRATQGRSGLTPPSGGRQAQQRSQGKPGRRILPAPPQSGNVRSPSGGASRSRQGPAAQSRRPVKQPDPAADDDSWLEGCF